MNDFLTQAHNTDGSLKTDSVGAAQLKPSAVASANIADGAITNAKLDSATQTSLTKADASVQSVNGNTPTNGDLPLATSDLSDAAISSPANGQVLTYDNTAGKWKNSAPASAPVASVVGQTGVITGAMIAGDSALSGTYGRKFSVDARDFGAIFNGVTDVTDAIQAAINECASAGGGDVELPAGDGLVNGGLVWPINKMIRLRGQGPTASGGIYATRLKRSSGATPIIVANGTGQGANQRCLIGLQDIGFVGGDRPASVVQLSRTSMSYLTNIRVSNNNGGSGLEIREMWDSRMHCVYVQLCGGGGTIPAVLFGDVVGESAVAVTDGVHITTMAIHSSYGPDLRITGNKTLSAPSSNIQFVNLNIEGTGSGTGGAPDTSMNIDLDYAQNCTFTNTRISLPTGRASSVVINQASGASGVRANHFTNTVLDTPGTSSPAIYIQQTGGALSFSDLSISGSATNTMINIASSVAAGRFKLRNFINGQAVMNSGFISDARTVVERIGRGIIPARIVKSTNTPTTISPLLVYPLNDSVSDSVFAQVPIPSDADGNGKAWIRVTWSATVAGNALLRWNGKTIASGDDPTTAGTARDVVAAASATPGRVNVTEWAANSQGFPSTPGALLAIEVQRIGSDAADTIAGTVNIISVEMSYNQRF